MKRPRERNPITLCYNPVLVISLCCEFLLNIGQDIKIFEEEGIVLSRKLQILGKKIISTMTEEIISKAYLQIDFKNRTVLNIITTYGFVPLMLDPKIEILLEEAWEGRNTYECDGKLMDFSLLTHLLHSPLIKLPGKALMPSDLIKNGFKANVKESKFWFQFKFRHTSIS